MSSRSPFKYKSSGFSEPGIFVELYLSKKAKYQRILYKTLTNGFDFELVKRHFLGSKKKQIQTVLEHHSQWRKYSDKSIREMVPFYWGYSLYEVDGVFYSKMAKRKSARRIIEERTQVIRLMFVPDMDTLASKLDPTTIERRDILDVVKHYLRISGHRRGQHGANVIDKSLIERMKDKGDSVVGKNIENGNIAKILDFVEKWFDDVGLFLFGYLIFEICRGLQKLGDADEVDYEEEIWLTSFWNLNINRVTYLKSAGSQGAKGKC